MIANYHSHTWRCMHAAGTEREYVENAIAGGLKILGFSDHSPMPYDQGYVSGVRMSLSQLEDYVTTILKLKEEYQKEIQIYLGLEAEYYPKYFKKLLDILSDYPMDYLILGQHFLGNEIRDTCSFNPTKDPETLERYCRQVVEGLKTGAFTYLAHPDLMPFVGDPKVYDHWMRWLCEQTKELQIPLEINLLGIWDHRDYPNARFWEIAGTVGNDVVIGSDAHRKDKVWVPQAVETAEKIVRDNHLNLLETLKLHCPKKGETKHVKIQ